MAYWRVRNPDDFLPSFHDAMRQGEGQDKIAWAGYTREGLNRAAEDFRLFRFCIRQYPSHPLYKVERGLIHRTHKAFDRQTRQWRLLLNSRRNVLEDCTNLPESLRKTY